MNSFRKEVKYMKRTIIGAALLLCGTIGVSTQRVIDAIFTANDWQLSHSGFNLLYGISLTALVIGVILCILSLKTKGN